MRWIFAISIVFSLGSLQAQELQSDTIDIPDSLQMTHSPKKATILSVILPGAGQVYNKKAWKAPIIYAGLGTSFYLSQLYRDEYRYYRDNYRLAVDGDSTTTVDDALRNFPASSIKAERDQYRQWMENSYLAMGLIYFFQVIDANVDAHLYYFDVSDDLSIQWEPQVRRYGHQAPTYGVGLTFHLK